MNDGFIGGAVARRDVDARLSVGESLRRGEPGGHVLFDAIFNWVGEWLEVPVSDHLVRLDVGPGHRDHDLVAHGRRRAVARVATLLEPEAQHFLVAVLRLLPGGEALRVARRPPEARRVGRMNFVHHDQLAVNQAELVLGVDQDQPSLTAKFGSEGKERQRRPLHVRVDRFWHEIPGDDLVAGEALVVAAGGAPVCRRRDDGLGQLLVLDEAVGEFESIDDPLAARVGAPDRGAGHTGEVAAHDHLDRDRLALARDGHVRIRRGNEVIRDDVARLLEPERGELVEDRALVGDAAEVDVEGRLAVGGDKHAPAILDVEVAHFAALLRPEPRQVDLAQDERHRRLDRFG